MTSKLTVYVDDSIQKLLRESADEESLSKIVNDALASYLSAGLARDLSIPNDKESVYPSLTEVEKQRPKIRESSTEIISKQRKKRNEALSR